MFISFKNHSCVQVSRLRCFFSFLVFVTVWCFEAHSYITPKEKYYGREFIEKVRRGHLKDQELLNSLHQIVSQAHIKNEHSDDEIKTDCPVPKGEEDFSKPDLCIKHVSLGYDKARQIMFGHIHLDQNQEGEYFVKDVYCEREFTDKDFGGTPSIGPELLPKSGNLLNTEHTWPQSRFTTRFSKSIQQSDLHHLFPTDSKMNSTRSSFRFGLVVKELEKLKCSQNKIGAGHQGEGTVFEPPVAHRGNVARAIFYFATRYQMKLSPAEQKILKEWNQQDPVDQFEAWRNDQVEDVQGNRNPYVDYPELIQNLSAVTFDTVK